MNLSISKRALWKYVNIKINRIIHHYHVFSIITILFDEMLKDLTSGIKIKIFNFGTLSLNNLKSRRHFDITKKQVVVSKGHRILRFKLAPQIRKRICELLDIDKTFSQK